MAAVVFRSDEGGRRAVAMLSLRKRIGDLEAAAARLPECGEGQYDFGKLSVDELRQLDDIRDRAGPTGELAKLSLDDLRTMRALLVKAAKDEEP